MAINPLYRNEFYFFSNMYDETLITDFYRKISTESYARSKEYQQNMLGRKRHRLNSEIFYKATLGDFVIDDDYNISVNLPAGSKTLEVNTLILPVFNKKKFLTTYGIKYQKIPLVDFLKHNDIFDKSITLQIGQYRIMSACLICNDDKTIRLAIPNSNTDGILTTNFDKIKWEYSDNEPVWIFSDEITQAYYTDTTAAASVTNSLSEEYYDVKVPTTAKVNTIGTDRLSIQSNSWDCLISFDSKTYGRKLLVSTPCSLKSSTASNLIFTVNKEFIDMIKLKSVNFNIWFIHRPNKKHVVLYPYSSETSPILDIEYNDNPSGNINIEVFEVDPITLCKGRKLYDPEFTQVYFPNIFDFSKLNVNNSDLLIEVTEYSPKYTNQIMTNSIKPLIDSLSHEAYTDFIINERDKSLDGISMNLKNYHPKYYPLDANEFSTGDFNDDFRGYVLDKITKTIESDPYLISSYYKWMLAKNEKVTTLSGTPKTFCFGTTKTGEFTGSNKPVMDTSVASVISDDIQKFTEAHSYITYFSSNDKCPAYVYINGKYIRPTCTRYYKGLNYLFFPVKLIENEMSNYSTNAELVAASPITIDIYPKSYNSFVECPKDNIVIESVNDVIKLFEHIDSPVYSLDDIVVYNTATGEYLGSLLDIFNINLIVSQYQIEHPGVTNKILIARGENPEYLLTALGELYTTMDTQSIMLAGAEVGLNLNEFVNDMISEGIISNDEVNAFTHKRIDFNDLEFTPKDISLIGMDLTIYNRAYKQEWIVKSTNGLYDSTNDTTVYEIANAHIDYDLNRFFIFKDGLFNTSAKLSKNDNKFSSSLTLTLSGNQTTKEFDIQIVHMPICYHTDSFHFQNRVFYMKPASDMGNNTDTLWPIVETDGVILQNSSGRIYNNFPFDSNTNMKFDAAGHRLPPKSVNTNSIYNQYYNNDRIAASRMDMIHDGTVLFIDNDCPINKIAKQNLYSDSYDDTYCKNPLDVLTYIEE